MLFSWKSHLFDVRSREEHLVDRLRHLVKLHLSKSVAAEERHRLNVVQSRRRLELLQSGAHERAWTEPLRLATLLEDRFLQPEYLIRQTEADFLDLRGDRELAAHAPLALVELHRQFARLEVHRFNLAAPAERVLPNRQKRLREVKRSQRTVAEGKVSQRFQPDVQNRLHQLLAVLERACPYLLQP